uniref:Uncharacterized protein n=1 Tax=Brassica oleracea var. oleracea TaxID=109376 RepID=A0A0D3BC34_BRAOL
MRPNFRGKSEAINGDLCERGDRHRSRKLHFHVMSVACILNRAALRGSGFEYCWLLSYEQEVRLELSGVPKNIGDHISQLFPSGANSLGEALILFFQSKQFIDSL